MRKRLFASYGAVAAVTALAATVFTACVPEGTDVVAAPMDLSEALAWPQSDRPATAVPASGDGAPAGPAPAARTGRS